MQTRTPLLATLTGLVLIAVVATIVLAAPDGPPRATGEGGFALELDITPEPDEPNIYRARAEVRDLATDTVLARPQVLFPRGEAAMLRSGIQPGLEIVLEITVEDDERKRAVYAARVLRDGTVISSQRVRVTL